MDVPPVVANKAKAVGAHHWLASLASLVAGVEADWDLRVGRAYPDATEAFVAEAVRGDGTPAVLKLVVPRDVDAIGNELTALRHASGRGLVALLEADLDRGALLLERLGPMLRDLGLPLRRRHEILCAAAAQVWRPAGGLGLPTGADKARWLADFVATTWDDLDHPCSEAAVAHALSCAERRGAAHDDERAVLVHGDVHQWNALEADDGFKLVDPDGLLAEAEYDIGVIMREDPEELLADADPMARAHELAELSGRDAVAIWEWGVVERVSTGLLCLRDGIEPIGSQMLAAADAIASSR